MKVLFKQPRCIEGVDYAKGTHEVPDSLSSHWFFLAQVQNGVCLIQEGPAAKEPVKPEVPEHKPTYHEHMAAWDSKKDKEARGEEATQEEAEQMVKSGEAEIPEVAIMSEADLEAAEKAAKQKAANDKRAATKAAKKAAKHAN